MRDDIDEAIESARSDISSGSLGSPVKRRSRSAIIHTLLSVIRELPEDMTIMQLREGLEE